MRSIVVVVSVVINYGAMVIGAQKCGKLFKTVKIAE